MALRRSSIGEVSVRAPQEGSAFTSVGDLDLDLVLSIQHQRIVRNDNTVLFDKTILQLPKTEQRLHHVRCDVLVHEFVDGDLGVSYQGKPLGRFSQKGKLRIEERRGRPRKVADLVPYTRSVAGPVWKQSGRL
jgi:hypothetical protein